MSEASDLQLIQFLYDYGHLQYPFGQYQEIPRDLTKLSLRDKEVAEAVRSHQELDFNYNWLVDLFHGGRALNADGDVGPATRAMVSVPRCKVPDYGFVYDTEPAIGSGSWKGCHNIGNFHSAGIKVMDDPPDFLAPHWDTVKRRVVEAYDEIGLHWVFDMQNGGHQTALSFASDRESDGWIGLAIVGQNETCTSQPIWLKLLASYKGGNSDEAIITQWTTLTKHELGHNTGMGHSRGGVMNPSIVNGLPVSWKGDPSESILRKRFGGERVPGAQPPPGPEPPGPDGYSLKITGSIEINGYRHLLMRDPGFSEM